MNITTGKQSSFFRIAESIGREIYHPKVKRYSEEILVPKIYSHVLGDTQNILVMEVDNISVISSPEAEAVSGAGLVDGGKFILPRYHLGVKAQLDMEVAGYQLTQTRLLKKILRKCNDNNSGIIYFAREGHLTEWQKAVYLATHKNLPTTLVSIGHEPANNKFSRVATISGSLKLEGFANGLEYLFLCDPIASGMQHVALLEKLIDLGSKIQNLVVIAPMATFYGLKIIRSFCQKNNINFFAGVYSCLLDTVEPLRYFSPYPENENMAADQYIHRLISHAYMGLIHKSCIRCNWTSSFWGGNLNPLEASDSELVAIGQSNKSYQNLSDQVSKKIKNNKKVTEKLTPFSVKLFSKYEK